MSACEDHIYLRYRQDSDLCAQPEPQREVGVALFGLGRIGQLHFQNLVCDPRVRLLYCAETNPETLSGLLRKVKNTGTELIHGDDIGKVFADPRVDAVVICSPTYTHKQLTLEALKSEKAVFCEKPLANDYAGIQHCYEVAAKVSKPLLCAFNRRFDPNLCQIKKRVDDGQVGKVQVVKTCSRDCPIPSFEYLRISGGIFHDCGVHDIDIICWLLGEYPTTVTAYGHAFIPEIRALDDFDTVAIIMSFPSGAMGIIDLSRNAPYGYDQRVEVFGPKGMLTSPNMAPVNICSHSPEGTTKSPICYTFISRYRESYVYEMEHFLNAVQGKTEVSVKAAETLAVCRVASACEESARSGKTVKIDWK